MNRNNTTNGKNTNIYLHVGTVSAQHVTVHKRQCTVTRPQAVANRTYKNPENTIVFYHQEALIAVKKHYQSTFPGKKPPNPVGWVSTHQKRVMIYSIRCRSSIPNIQLFPCFHQHAEITLANDRK